MMLVITRICRGIIYALLAAMALVMLFAIVVMPFYGVWEPFIGFCIAAPLMTITYFAFFKD